MTMLRPLAPMLCLLALAACAGPVTMAPQGSLSEIHQETMHERELAYKRVIEDRDRIYNIAFPLLAANAPFCGGKTAPAFGMTAWNLAAVGRDYKAAAQALYNLQDRLAVQNVADTSPAAAAGIRSGDFIIAINGQSIPPGQKALKTAARALEQGGYRQAEIVTERNGQARSTILQPVEACDYPVQLDSNSSDINAFADGRRIVISKGIVRFAENDNEVALVIAHELGHNAMRHIDKRQGNAIAGTIGGLALDSLLAAAGVPSGNEMTRLGQELGSSAYSVAFEQEADYVGMYFMERAGYNSSHVADFWRRMAADNPRSVSARRDHPTSPERFIAIERTHREILQKKSQGGELITNFRQQ